MFFHLFGIKLMTINLNQFIRHFGSKLNLHNIIFFLVSTFETIEFKWNFFFVHSFVCYCNLYSFYRISGVLFFLLPLKISAAPEAKFGFYNYYIFRCRFCEF